MRESSGRVGLHKRRKLFGVMGMFAILDCDDSFKGVYMSRLTKLYTLNICSLFYVSYALIKPFKEKKPLFK